MRLGCARSVQVAARIGLQESGPGCAGLDVGLWARCRGEPAGKEFPTVQVAVRIGTLRPSFAMRWTRVEDEL